MLFYNENLQIAIGFINWSENLRLGFWSQIKTGPSNDLPLMIVPVVMLELAHGYLIAGTATRPVVHWDYY
jgi:hypothetical protein